MHNIERGDEKGAQAQREHQNRGLIVRAIEIGQALSPHVLPVCGKESANGFDDEPRYAHEQSKGDAKPNGNAYPNGDTAGLHNTQSRDNETYPADNHQLQGIYLGSRVFKRCPQGVQGRCASNRQ